MTRELNIPCSECGGRMYLTHIGEVYGWNRKSIYRCLGCKREVLTSNIRPVICLDDNRKVVELPNRQGFSLRDDK